MALLIVSLLFTALAVGVVLHWRAALRAAPPVDPEAAVAVRLRLRPWDEDLVERGVRRALASADFHPAGADAWGDRGGATVRVLPPVVGDRATLVELPAARADAVVGGLVDALLDEGFEVSRQQRRRVKLRRGPERCSLVVDPV